MLSSQTQNTGMIVNGAPKSRAEELMAQHAQEAAQGPTVEDVVDEEDILHPPPSATVAPAKTPAKTPAAAAAAAALDVQSEESFPALGGPKASSRPSAVPVAWGGSKPQPSAAGAATSTAPAPASVPAPAPAPTPASSTPRQLNIPGKHVDQFRFDSSQMLPRSELKKPVSDILRDISKKSKVRLEVREGAGGVYIFEGTGNVDAVRQALKEVAQQVGSTVSLFLLLLLSFLLFISFLLFLFSLFYLILMLTVVEIRQGPCAGFGQTTHHWPSRSCHPRHPRPHWSPHRRAQARRVETA